MCGAVGLTALRQIGYNSGMVSIPIIRYSPEQYLAIERNAEFKSELVMGEMLAMAGASKAHNEIERNLSGHLLKLMENRVQTTQRHESQHWHVVFLHPDVSVYCGGMILLDNSNDVALNPTLIVEILSKSTEGYDLIFKLGKYSEIASLKELVYISQDMVMHSASGPPVGHGLATCHSHGSCREHPLSQHRRYVDGRRDLRERRDRQFRTPHLVRRCSTFRRAPIRLPPLPFSFRA